jgi:hypothetical protein
MDEALSMRRPLTRPIAMNGRLCALRARAFGDLEVHQDQLAGSGGSTGSEAQVGRPADNTTN